MVAIKPKTTVTMKMAGTGTSHSRTDVSVRDVESTIDEPIERGGTNMGLSPTETLMGALLGCTNVITQKIAESHGIHIKELEIGLEAQFDRRGVLLQEEVDLPFPAVTLNIDVTTDADEAQIETIKRELSMYCPVSKVFRQSGTRITENWTVTRG